MIKKLLLTIIIILILVPVISLGMLGFVPGLSSILGTDKPRDLKIRYTQANLQSIRSKSQVQYITLPDNSSPLMTRQFSGKRGVTASFSSEEITATLNNQPWKYWPYQNVQVKFNADGSGEISGILIKNKVPGYASAIGIPAEAIDFAMKYLPSNPVFYVKGKAALANNKVTLFEPEKFEIGRISIPVGIFLASGNFDIISKAYAQNLKDMTDDLTKVQNKKELIVGYINSRLSSAFGNFYAKTAYGGENKLFFEGTLPEKLSYTP